MASVADSHHLIVDPGQAFHFNRIRIQLFNVVRIRILIKVMGICDQWFLGPPGLRF
jgi:hypothetical protein